MPELWGLTDLWWADKRQKATNLIIQCRPYKTGRTFSKVDPTAGVTVQSVWRTLMLIV
ncbi:hypothetical protein PILCRDRAFT_821487 [Piloderma croceum F 1598]|uniref:Uncharacterized protein n=1 Tax=Piloderma croceum (strain F 1598) TaxID=765440 RepID=A0A0C3BVK0_PILCF|nr:hypothetical protein PILCRDRAFT_821487 [Piloderma croceum F 1598]